MKTYNWQLPDWPHFKYDLAGLHESLLAIAEQSGLIRGKLAHLAQAQQTEAMIDLLIEEAVKTSEIEGEYISRIDVRSSIKNQLGINAAAARIHDKRAQGVVEMMLEARRTYEQPLTDTMLYDWHLMLLSASTNPNLQIGGYRTHEEAMQIVSGHHGKWRVHFEAPPASQVPKEMNTFITWFNRSAPGTDHSIKDAPVRAAIAHLYFESIHPFDDGNGRLGRAISEKALSQGWGYPVLLSLSQAIEAEKKAYYDALQQASTNNEITDWLHYFVGIILKAQSETENQINYILKKSTYFDKFKHQFNERQLKAIERMLRSGIKGFEGGMTAKKYMVITKTSKATATRDLHELHTMGALQQLGAGRSVRYELNL